MISLRDHGTRKMLFLLLALVLIILLLMFGKVARMVIIAALLSYILDPLVVRMEARGISRTAAASIILLTISILMLLAIVTVVPAIKDQMVQMGSGDNSAKTDLALSRLQEVVRAKLGWLGYGEVDLKTKLQEFKVSSSQKLVDYIVSDFIELIITLVTIPFLIFFFIKDALTFKKGLIRTVPNRFFEFTLDLIYKMDQQLGNYLRGQFIDAVSIGILATVGLGILGVPYFFIIGPFSAAAPISSRMSAPSPAAYPPSSPRSWKAATSPPAATWRCFLSASNWRMTFLSSPWRSRAASTSTRRSSWLPALSAATSSA